MVAVHASFGKENVNQSRFNFPASQCIPVQGVALLRRPTFEPLFPTHPSEVGSTSPWTLLAATLLDTRCRTLARRRAPRSWSQLACALAWTVLATCSLRTSSRLRRRSRLTQLVPLVLCLGRCSVKLWCGPLSRPICPQTTTLCGVYGSLSSLKRTQRTPRRCAQLSSRPTRRSPVTRSTA